ncbi:MAG: hypothetical protein M3R53_10220 [Candidatus Eremiobacteraeota bacterium]|nr:hypothetical protein [Candidatus Eremiobacteraeota bacterium]
MNTSALSTSIRSAAVAGVLSLATVLSFAAPLPASAATAIAAGTTISGTLSSDLDSAKAQIGDGFTVAVTRPYPNNDPSYSASYVRGHVAKVTRAGQGRKAELGLAFDSIVLANGASAPLTGHVVHVDQKQKSAVIQQAAGAALGMIVGNYMGKHIGTNLGGLAGAAGGFLYANNMKTNFSVPKGSAMTLQTDRSVPRPQARY